MSPADLDAIIQQAVTAGDPELAVSHAARASASGMASPFSLQMLAWSRETTGDLDGAGGLLRQALALDPVDPFILAALADITRKRGDSPAALILADEAIEHDPLCAPAWLARGYAADAAGSIKTALASFRRAAMLDPVSAPAWAGAAYAAARLGLADEAEAAAGRSLAINPAEPLAILAAAHSEIQRRDFVAAATRLESVPSGTMSGENHVLSLAMLGEALDGIGEYAQAHHSFASSNRAFLDHFGAGPTLPQTEFVNQITRGLAALDPSNWASQPARPTDAEPEAHIFLLGFPRSGTTLIENALAGLEGAFAIEERPTLETADRAFLVPEDGMARLAGLGEGDAERFRADYWDRVRAAGIPAAAPLFLDMDPLKSIRLPIIARLFPQAKIILMRRDPRDVIWSCFRTCFAPTSSAFEFASLERTALLYAATMRLLDQCRAILPLNVFELQYEKLVKDFAAETQALCNFLDVSWSQNVLQFGTTAAGRHVNTASVSQLQRGLYDGSRQWQPYRRYLDPILPIIEPWLPAES